ncbi:glycosyltransferase family 2 protein [Loktanella sp. S4079]|uniref:glycosyltransferase family 2 protein n=1 Tax=Loktanella sp. S4079 TaxID=579483 RepID=UPI0005FA7473|nr:glycosyltransferase family 2 protein [Loktanella sp. S4079]KJZ20664.1 family 2 glycosyl transferase [Loktanella sp. S4079]
MKISVVTAVRNGARTIPDAIQSLRSQTYSDVEHIVQDGGSQDGTLAYLSDNAHPQMSLLSEPDNGIYDAINRGIARASGDVIGLLHADDMLADPTILEKVASAMCDPQIDGVYGDLQYVTHSETARIVRHWQAGQYDRRKLGRGWMPPHPTLYLRRSVFERYGVYDPTYRISGDYDAMLRYLVQGNLRLAYLPHVMVQMRLGGASNRSWRQLIRKSQEDYRAIKQHQVGGIGTLLAKNLSKLPQFFTHP